MERMENWDQLKDLNNLENLDELVDLEELEELEPETSIKISLEDMLKGSALDSLPLPSNWLKSSSPFEPLFICDNHLELQWYNSSLVELFGPREMPDVHHLSQLIKLPQGDQRFQKLLLALKKQENNFQYQCSLDVVIPQRGMCHLVLMLLPLMGDSGYPTHYLGIIQDQTDHQRRLVFRTFQSLLEASLLKDNDTGNHVKRVNAYSGFLAKCVKEDGRFSLVNHQYINDIAYLAAMHDVGKIGTPDDILNKEGPLEEWEMNIMKEHTTNGGFILANYPNPMAKDIALNHHERWDGTGYPFGKVEDMIPLSARIVAIADVYDALRSKRSYKKAWSHDKSCQAIFIEAGSHFDPYIVDIFHTNHRRMNQIWQDMND
ncbi:MAG: HD domain-containing protein [Spirochaetaceae bacterium]|jgi:HD-GYP domain-containing protein (c-di-GMP phosphodiesterase class II)|nr:HD domain-containing protein [Spirochaetaceae bacterium]